MSTVYYRDAIREAMREEMLRDERVFIMGEDVADHGGNFLTTRGILEEFGPKRIFDTPLSEAAIAGAGVGAAMMGLRPIIEIMYADFLPIAMDAIVNRAAKVSYMTGGAVTAPLVIRSAYGAGRRTGAHHSQSTESWFLNVPGLTIVAPSTSRDAKGLLKSSIRSDNPVLFLEHKLLYAKRGEVEEGDYTIPLGEAEIRRAGNDVTVVSYGRMVDMSLAASDRLRNNGVSAEVIDLRTLYPLDSRQVIESVKRTGRLVIVHEAPVFGGFGGEVAAIVAEHALGYLDAPIRRVGAPWTPVPYSPTLEDAYIPQVEDVVEAIESVLR